MKPVYWLGLLSLFFALTACTLVPEPEPAPRLIQLHSLDTEPSSTASSSSQVRLTVERPLASAPLRQTEIWYQNEDFLLLPFSRHLWAESLDLQIQGLLTEYLAAQPWAEAVSLDKPGFRSDFRLRLRLQHWYLDTRQEKLIVHWQANLLDHQGNSLAQKQWRYQQPVQDLSAPGVAQSSQKALQKGAEGLNTWLKEQWNKSI